MGPVSLWFDALRRNLNLKKFIISKFWFYQTLCTLYLPISSTSIRFIRKPRDTLPIGLSSSYHFQWTFQINLRQYIAIVKERIFKVQSDSRILSKKIYRKPTRNKRVEHFKMCFPHKYIYFMYIYCLLWS